MRAGAFLAGIVLEGSGLAAAAHAHGVRAGDAVVLAITAFAGGAGLSAGAAALFVAGLLELSFNSMSQSLVQLYAPAAVRGRVIGLLRHVGDRPARLSGATVGIGGSFVGIHAVAGGLAACTLLSIVGGLALAVAPRPGAGSRGG